MKKFRDRSAEAEPIIKAEERLYAAVPGEDLRLREQYLRPVRAGPRFCAQRSEDRGVRRAGGAQHGAGSGPGGLRMRSICLLVSGLRARAEGRDIQLLGDHLWCAHRNRVIRFECLEFLQPRVRSYSRAQTDSQARVDRTQPRPGDDVLAHDGDVRIDPAHRVDEGAGLPAGHARKANACALLRSAAGDGACHAHPTRACRRPNPCPA